MTMWTAERLAELPEPGTPVRSERASVRREILARLREANDAMRILTSTWDAGRRLWTGGNFRSATGSTWPQSWRFRLWGEYPENNPPVLRRHALTLHRIASALNDLAIRLDNEATEAERVARTRSDAPNPRG